MNRELQAQIKNIDQNQLIRELEAFVHEYPTATNQINALEFLLSNYKVCQNGCYCTLSNQAYPILLFLEKLHLVEKSEKINFFYRPSFTFKLTSYGIEFYNNISKY